MHVDFFGDENDHKSMFLPSLDGNKESWFPMIPHNHIIVFGSHNQVCRKYLFVIILANDDVFSGHLLSASPSSPTGMSNSGGEKNMADPFVSPHCVS